MIAWNITPAQWRRLDAYDRMIMLAHYKERNLRKAQAQYTAEWVTKEWAKKEQDQ